MADFRRTIRQLRPETPCLSVAVIDVDRCRIIQIENYKAVDAPRQRCVSFSGTCAKVPSSAWSEVRNAVSGSGIASSQTLAGLSPGRLTIMVVGSTPQTRVGRSGQGAADARGFSVLQKL